MLNSDRNEEQYEIDTTGCRVRGNVQISFALAKESAAAGYEVLVATKECFRYLAEMYDIPFYSLGGTDDNGIIF